MSFNRSVLLWAAMCVLVPAACAIGGPEPLSMMGRSALERYAELLALDEEQSPTVRALYDGYTTEYRSASRAYRSACEQARRESGSDEAKLKERRATERASYAGRTRELERSFFDDLKSLLTAAQDEAWPRVERMRRRSLLLRGVVSGESVDLTELVRSLRLAGSDRAALDAPLEAYELEIDRALKAKEQLRDEEDPFSPLEGFSSHTLIARTVRAREVGLRIRGVNEQAARAIETVLPESRRAEFRSLYQRAAYPGVYRPTPTERLLESIANLDDLDGDQRQQLAVVHGGYRHELAAANERLAAAQAAAEADGSSVTATMPSGESMLVLMGKIDSNPVMQARKGREELDQRTRDRILAFLRPAQIDSLPEAESPKPAEQLFMDDISIMIVRGGG